MADQVFNTSELKLNCKFDDDDTRILTFDNPQNNISAQTIHDIETDMITNQPMG